MSTACTSAKVAEVLFLQQKKINSRLEQQGKDKAAPRKKRVTRNGNIVTRVVDAIFLLGKQGLAFRSIESHLQAKCLTHGIIRICDNDCGPVEWKESRVRHARVMDGEIAKDEPEETPYAQWKRETFHVAVDTH